MRVQGSGSRVQRSKVSSFALQTPRAQTRQLTIRAAFRTAGRRAPQEQSCAAPSFFGVQGRGFRVQNFLLSRERVGASRSHKPAMQGSTPCPATIFQFSRGWTNLPTRAWFGGAGSGVAAPYFALNRGRHDCGVFSFRTGPLRAAAFTPITVYTPGTKRSAGAQAFASGPKGFARRSTIPKGRENDKETRLGCVNSTIANKVVGAGATGVLLVFVQRSAFLTPQNEMQTSASWRDSPERRAFERGPRPQRELRVTSAIQEDVAPGAAFN